MPSKKRPSLPNKSLIALIVWILIMGACQYSILDMFISLKVGLAMMGQAMSQGCCGQNSVEFVSNTELESKYAGERLAIKGIGGIHLVLAGLLVVLWFHARKNPRVLFGVFPMFLVAQLACAQIYPEFVNWGTAILVGVALLIMAFVASRPFAAASA